MKDMMLDLLDKVDRAVDETARSLRDNPRLALHEFANRLANCPFYFCLGASHVAPPDEAPEEIIDDLRRGIWLLNLVHATSSADCSLDDDCIERILEAEIESMRNWSAMFHREVARIWKDPQDLA